MRDKKYFWYQDDYEPQNDFAPTRSEKAILNALKDGAELSRQELIMICKIRKQSFLEALKSLVEAGAIDRQGKGTRGSGYIYTASTKE